MAHKLANPLRMFSVPATLHATREGCQDLWHQRSSATQDTGIQGKQAIKTNRQMRLAHSRLGYSLHNHLGYPQVKPHGNTHAQSPRVCQGMPGCQCCPHLHHRRGPSSVRPMCLPKHMLALPSTGLLLCCGLQKTHLLHVWPLCTPPMQKATLTTAASSSGVGPFNTALARMALVHASRAKGNTHYCSLLLWRGPLVHACCA